MQEKFVSERLCKNLSSCSFHFRLEFFAEQMENADTQMLDRDQVDSFRKKRNVLRKMFIYSSNKLSHSSDML